MHVLPFSRNFVFFSLIVFLLSCYQEENRQVYSTFTFFSNITGTWKLVEKPMYETWIPLDKEFAGKVFVVKNNDTLIRETIRLIRHDTTWIYRVQVRDQNQGKPVDFRMRSADNNTVLFANPAHDFPIAIRYTLINKDSLVAQTSGTINGQQKTIEFHYVRQ